MESSVFRGRYTMPVRRLETTYIDNQKRTNLLSHLVPSCLPIQLMYGQLMPVSSKRLTSFLSVLHTKHNMANTVQRILHSAQASNKNK